MYDALRNLLKDDDFSIVESFEIQGQPARYSAIPQFLFDSQSSSVGLYLKRKFKHRVAGKAALWRHQVQALDALGRGDNVVISTGTASGKSLVFQSIAFHKVLLDPASRLIVFYPLKALAADQLKGWREMACSLGLNEDIIGRIDGSVQVKDRGNILENARIIVMTPDVCHAWLMSRLSLPVVRKFVRALSTLVMDEAHTLEGVFGSNFAFLIRRLIAARNHLLRDEAEASELQLVAATATIANPGEHMKRLTGSNFSVVGHEDDGAPQHERIVAHLACPTGEEIQVARDLHNRVLTEGREGGFITFLDSRKGVEGLALLSQDSETAELVEELFCYADVLPYRAGYDSEDRQKIEERLQSGSLRGVVSTSALELGIDIPHLRVGFNIGVPGTRKAYRQRLGRVGRNGPGAFVVVASPNEFRGYGTTFREYHDMSVEPSYLYLDNRFMQFAHGRCLAVELESLGASSKLPTKVSWPQGFKKMYSAARLGGRRPPEFDAVAALGGDTPQYGYPLRNVGEVNFQIKRYRDADGFGHVNQLQALRECYPGATYLHLARAYEITAWHTSSFEPFILVKRGIPGRLTQPRVMTWINAGLTPADLLENHIRKGKNGFLAECEMHITEKVEGYVDRRTGEFHSYRDLQQHNPNMRARSRNFRTSGVLLCIDHQWFQSAEIKRTFADRLREVFVREYSVASQDVGSAASNISVRTLDGGGLRNGCVVVFDETYGSLRLTEQLYLQFEHVLERLSVASKEETGSDNNFNSIVAQVQHELSKFIGADIMPDMGTDSNVSAGYERVFTPGSRVLYREIGQLAVEVEIIQPTLMNGEFMYQVKVASRPDQPPARRWILGSKVEPSGEADAWNYAWWNRKTESYEDPPDDL